MDTEVDVRGDEASVGAERADAEVADERRSAGDEAECAVVSVPGGCNGDTHRSHWRWLITAINLCPCARLWEYLFAGESSSGKTRIGSATSAGLKAFLSGSPKNSAEGG